MRDLRFIQMNFSNCLCLRRCMLSFVLYCFLNLLFTTVFLLAALIGFSVLLLGHFMERNGKDDSQIFEKRPS